MLASPPKGRSGAPELPAKRRSVKFGGGRLDYQRLGGFGADGKAKFKVRKAGKFGINQSRTIVLDVRAATLSTFEGSQLGKIHRSFMIRFARPVSETECEVLFTEEAEQRPYHLTFDSKFEMERFVAALQATQESGQNPLPRKTKVEMLTSPPEGGFGKSPALPPKTRSLARTTSGVLAAKKLAAKQKRMSLNAPALPKKSKEVSSRRKSMPRGHRIRGLKSLVPTSLTAVAQTEQRGEAEAKPRGSPMSEAGRSLAASALGE
jgi:hypothetical protein